MAESFECFAIVEIMGHQKYAGRVSEQTIGGQAFVRVDIPDVEGQKGFTKLFGGSSIFCITPTTEEIAKSVAKRYTQIPVQPYDLPDDWQQKIRQGRLPHIDDDDFNDDSE